MRTPKNREFAPIFREAPRGGSENFLATRKGRWEKILSSPKGVQGTFRAARKGREENLLATRKGREEFWVTLRGNPEKLSKRPFGAA
jgi:hypothetical protein